VKPCATSPRCSGRGKKRVAPGPARGRELGTGRAAQTRICGVMPFAALVKGSHLSERWLRRPDACPQVASLLGVRVGGLAPAVKREEEEEWGKKKRR
jgi:hypothetical protein